MILALLISWRHYCNISFLFWFSYTLMLGQSFLAGQKSDPATYRYASVTFCDLVISLPDLLTPGGFQTCMINTTRTVVPGYSAIWYNSLLWYTVASGLCMMKLQNSVQGDCIRSGTPSFSFSDQALSFQVNLYFYTMEAQLSDILSSENLCYYYCYTVQSFSLIVPVFPTPASQERVSLCNLGCCGTCSVVQGGLELIDIHLSLPPEYWD